MTLRAQAIRVTGTIDCRGALYITKVSDLPDMRIESSGRVHVVSDMVVVGQLIVHGGVSVGGRCSATNIVNSGDATFDTLHYAVGCRRLVNSGRMAIRVLLSDSDFAIENVCVKPRFVSPPASLTHAPQFLLSPPPPITPPASRVLRPEA